MQMRRRHYRWRPDGFSACWFGGRSSWTGALTSQVDTSHADFRTGPKCGWATGNFGRYAAYSGKPPRMDAAR